MGKKTLKLAVFTAVLGLVLYMEGMFAPAYAYHARYTMLLALAGVFWISDFVSGSEALTISGPAKLMLSLVMRFLLAIIVAVVFVFAFKADTRVFAVNFGGVYLSFLGFEIYSLLTNFRTASKNAGIDETDDHIKV
ncbi:hypothetical protein [Fulvitalea axinellae]